MVLHVGRSRPIETVRHPWRRRFGERRDVEAISFCGAVGLSGARSQPEYGRLRSSPGARRWQSEALWMALIGGSLSIEAPEWGSDANQRSIPINARTLGKRAGEFQSSQLQRQIWFRLSASSKSCQMSGGKVSSPSFIRFIAIRLAVLTRACRSAGEMPLNRLRIS